MSSLLTHNPVLLEEVLAHLNLRTGMKVIDGTLGLGGHSFEILKRIGPTGRLLGIDRDEVNLKMAQQKLEPYRDQIELVHGTFSDLASLAKTHHFSPVSAILLDLGLSSPHVDDAERGFSFQSEGPLDMRYDRTQGLTAADVVNRYSELELIRVFRDLGEEPRARKVAHLIAAHRKEKLFRTTKDLVTIIPKLPWGVKRHPATLVFQALRMEVNHELEHLEKALHEGIKLLTPGGRIAVISYHSLEDRLVKNTFRYYTRDCICPQEMPVCQCNFQKTLYLITKKPIIPSGIEVSHNSRARSAKLRVAERV